MLAHSPDPIPRPTPEPTPNPDPDPFPQPAEPPVRIVDLPPNTPPPSVPVDHSETQR